ncbi:MAG: pyruvate kinase [Gammaproteobacteria bacterium]|nr:pyruvate kinase [Gammaproteobacteria bacterium]MBQ0839174.1 pyruvate kinase [Gammaproteobacteria bacterium]
MRKTKIICTIGPATSSLEMLTGLADAGMNVARLNMSHGEHNSTAEVIAHIQQLNKTRTQTIAILLDTQGPEIRTSDIEGEHPLVEGSIVSVVTDSENKIDENTILINYKELIDDVNVGDKIILDNGLINLQVLEKNEQRMKCQVIDGGVLKSKKHVNLPGVRVKLPAITEKDKKDIAFARAQQVDFIALSFVRRASDIAELQQLLGDDIKKIKIIAKIEDQEGLENLEDIIAASDGIMVARGDLGVEIPLEILPRVQRRIIRQCAIHGKRVIVATHMLESMIDNPTPTRAEVTDVANAVYEEADAIMLSGETTIGKYPVRCVETLDRIARSIEKSRGLLFSDDLILDNDKQQISAAAVRLAESIGAKGMIVPTKTGRMANYVTNCHPQTPVICAFSFDEHTHRQLVLNRNVRSYRIDFNDNPEIMLAAAAEILLQRDDFSSDDKVVVISDTLSRANIDAIQIRSLGSLKIDAPSKA